MSTELVTLKHRRYLTDAEVHRILANNSTLPRNAAGAIGLEDLRSLLAEVLAKRLETPDRDSLLAERRAQLMDFLGCPLLDIPFQARVEPPYGTNEVMAAMDAFEANEVWASVRVRAVDVGWRSLAARGAASPVRWLRAGDRHVATVDIGLGWWSDPGLAVFWLEPRYPQTVSR